MSSEHKRSAFLLLGILSFLLALSLYAPPVFSQSVPVCGQPCLDCDSNAPQWHFDKVPYCQSSGLTPGSCTLKIPELIDVERTDKDTIKITVKDASQQCCNPKKSKGLTIQKRVDNGPWQFFTVVMTDIDSVVIDGVSYGVKGGTVIDSSAPEGHVYQYRVAPFSGPYNCECAPLGWKYSRLLGVPAPTVDLKINNSDGPLTVDPGTTLQLNWTSTNATSCTASGSWSGSKNVSGSQTIASYPSPATFTISCTGPGGTAQDSVVVNVRTTPPNPKTLTVSLQAVPFSGTAPLSGVDLKAVVSGTAQGDITYKFDCTNDGTFEKTLQTSQPSYTAKDLCTYTNPDTYFASVTVERDGLTATALTPVVVLTPTPQPPTVDLKINNSDGPLTVDPGTTLQLNWTSTNATSCTASGSWSGSRSLQGKEDVLITTFSVFTLTCSNSVGTAQDTVAVQITSPQLADIRVEKLVAKEGTSLFNDSLRDVKMGDIVRFKIRVTALNSTVYGLVVRDIMPPDLLYLGELKQNGFSIAGSIVSGIYLSSLEKGESIEWEYKAKINSRAESIINRVEVSANNIPTRTAYTTLFSEREPVSGVQLVKKVRNLTRGDRVFFDSVTARPEEVIRVKVEIKADRDVSGLFLREVIPSSYVQWTGNLKIDGKEAFGNILEGITLSDLRAGETRIIEFDLLLSKEEAFGFGATAVEDMVLLTGSGLSLSAKATVYVLKQQVAGAITEIPTGIDTFKIAWAIGSALFFVLGTLLYRFKNAEIPLSRQELIFLLRKKRLK